MTGSIERAEDVLNVLGARLTVKTTFDESGQFVLDHDVPPGYAVPAHAHADEEESCLVLAGEIVFTTDAGERRLGPGDFIHAPRGTRHAFRNLSGAPARMIVICTPGRKLEVFFRGLDAAARAGTLDGPTVAGLAVRNDIAL